MYNKHKMWTLLQSVDTRYTMYMYNEYKLWTLMQTVDTQFIHLVHVQQASQCTAHSCPCIHVPPKWGHALDTPCAVQVQYWDTYASCGHTIYTPCTCTTSAKCGHNYKVWTHNLYTLFTYNKQVSTLPIVAHDENKIVLSFMSRLKTDHASGKTKLDATITQKQII